MEQPTLAEQKINELIEQPISGSELKRKIPGVNIIEYSDLTKYETIDNVLGTNGVAAILYMTGPHF